MKYYLFTFSDYTETIGTAANKTEARKNAARYIRSWNLDIKVESVEEISETDYNSRKR